MSKLSYEDLSIACSSGGSSTLVSRTELMPAGGTYASIAPAKFVAKGRDAKGAYAYETRFVDGESRDVVLIDSKQSCLNRIEAQIKRATEDGDAPLSQAPHIAVRYRADGEDVVYSDLDLPHRAFDAHIRAGTVEGQPVTKNDEYKAIRNASPANARALLDSCPGALVFGSWDATRKSHQGRWRSALVGEIIGVLPEGHSGEPAFKGGARVDPVAMQVNVGGLVMKELADAQQDELSSKTHSEITKAAAKLKKGEAGSASKLGFGGIPPTLESLAGVSCARIIRTHVLSFAALRQMRFGSGKDADVACRALLAAYALAGLARADQELYLRANCDLREAGPTEVELDERGGAVRILEPLTVEDADDLLATALQVAQDVAGVDWSGQTFLVDGNEHVFAGALDAVDEETD